MRVTTQSHFPMDLIITDTNCPPTVIESFSLPDCIVSTRTFHAPRTCRIMIVNTALHEDSFICEGDNSYWISVDSCTPGAPVCPCNFNSDFVLNSQDFYDFVACFFGGGCPTGRTADYNRDGFVNTQDFFDFLVCFFNPPVPC